MSHEFKRYNVRMRMPKGSFYVSSKDEIQQWGEVQVHYIKRTEAELSDGDLFACTCGLHTDSPDNTPEWTCEEISDMALVSGIMER